jgi:hypothetical protein
LVSAPRGGGLRPRLETDLTVVVMEVVVDVAQGNTKLSGQIFMYVNLSIAP